ncbi:MAG: hypothetical protein PHP44_00505 [Kiritimatiellae bacterium]|nr:hypothetical protein [Kiritimatiellia bacterium]
MGDHLQGRDKIIYHNTLSENYQIRDYLTFWNYDIRDVDRADEPTDCTDDGYLITSRNYDARRYEYQAYGQTMYIYETPLPGDAY